MNGSSAQTSIFTIGYQGMSVDEFLKKLRRNSVRVLVDVRRNPISRKPGFSKKKLAAKLHEIGIDYHHLPELGIPSSRRKSLDMTNPETYKSLFTFFDETTPIALTCFDTDHQFCHRSKLIEIIQRDEAFAQRVCHI